MQPDNTTTVDNQFLDINGLRVRYATAGAGEPALLLLHGSFLSIFSWREVLLPLAQRGSLVAAFDRVAFGETSRPALSRQHERPFEHNPYSPEFQANLTLALMDHLGIEHAVLVGNSTGGTVALLTALRAPQRVRALVLVGAMVYSGYPTSEIPPWIRPMLPRRLMSLLLRAIIRRTHDSIVRSFWHDKTKVTPAILEAYRATLKQEGWHAAMWELILATHKLRLAEHLQKIQVPVLVVTGDHDHAVPTEQSIRLSRELPQARLVVVPNCGHLPHEEQPGAFLDATGAFLNELQ
jgi:pimeloyl-ACP methyl ester carboxylesterase